MPKPEKGRKPSAPSRFKVGDKVRVKRGVKDEEYPDIPIGGWAGTVVKSDKHGMYEIRWSQETLDRIHPVFKKRCERDGLILEQCGLGEDGLEPDPGGPLDIEQPTKIHTRPLSPKDEDDRIRMVFGLTTDDPLPKVDEKALFAYHRYLAVHLTFPFEARQEADYGCSERVKVIGLGGPDEEPMIDEMEGILCEVRVDREADTMPLAQLDFVKGKANRRLIEDYCDWFWDYQ